MTGAPLRTLCRLLGIGRATIYRPPRPRGATYAKAADPTVVAQVRPVLRQPHRGGIGYRTATYFVNLQFGTHYNPKRLYRVMGRYGLLVAHRRRPRSTRPHTGQVQRPASNERWCSDALAIACTNGEVAWLAFALDCHDRECLGAAAVARPLLATDIQQLMREAVAQRFATARVPGPVQWLSDNGPQYIALATVLTAEQLGLRPITTPAASPESNGMAESFARTLRRDYLAEADLRSSAMILAQVPGWLTDYNTVRPHSALGYLPPSVYRAQCEQKAKVSPS